MRKFLYISPYFPPQSRVGALRPLKFARHLRNNGWSPVILADLRPDDDKNRELADAIPGEVEVVRDYSKGARMAEARYRQGDLPPMDRDGAGKPKTDDAKPQKKGGLWDRIEEALPDALTPNPELIPLGRHSVDMAHATKAGQRILRRGSIDAIVVNADPYAALLVGERLAREFRIPLIADLRDPWTVCDLRRKMRPWPQLRLNDWMERRVVRTSAKVILNTQTALDAYRLHYADLPPERFTVIRNHGDPDLIAAGSFQRQTVFTMLFLGRLRRFVEGGQLIEALATLKARGFDSTRIQLTISGQLWKDTRRFAEKLTVADMLVDHPFVPYRQVGTFMNTADLLISLSHDTVQRIPAKLYDYAVSKRPILAIADNPEIRSLASQIGGATVCPLNNVSAIADAMEKEITLGRERTINRNGTGLDSASATRTLAGILDDAVSTATRDKRRR